MLTKSYFEDLMYGRNRSIFWEAVLSFLAIVYGAAIRIRLALYGISVFKRNKLVCPVVSIGNLTLGGTGKTPGAILVAGLLLKNGKRPAVVSRGYGRENPDAIAIVSDGSSVLTDAYRGGDEPVLIASTIPGVPVVVGGNRYMAAQEAVRSFHSGVIVLDDGFQHIQLGRTLDIVLVDARDPFGNGRLFPRGILREPLAGLKRAHAVVITNAGHAADLDGLKGTIRKNSNARIFTSKMIPLELVACGTGESKPLTALRGSRVLAFSGIARPASFSSLLETLGAVITRTIDHPDHHVFTKSDLAAIFRTAADNRVSMIVTTEKDAVRLNKLGSEGIWALRIAMAITEQDEWEKFILGNL